MSLRVCMGVCVRVCMGVSKRACGCDKGVYGGV